MGAAVMHRVFDPRYDGPLPSTVIHVEMDGTDRQMVLISVLEPSISAANAIGLRVKARFRPVADGAVVIFEKI